LNLKGIRLEAIKSTELSSCRAMHAMQAYVSSAGWAYVSAVAV